MHWKDKTLESGEVIDKNKLRRNLEEIGHLEDKCGVAKIKAQNQGEKEVTGLGGE